MNNFQKIFCRVCSSVVLLVRFVIGPQKAQKSINETDKEDVTSEIDIKTEYRKLTEIGANFKF